MPQLVKLQDQLKDTGFTIVAPHAQGGTDEEVAMVARQLKMMGIVVASNGSVPGEKVEGIPMQFLFDSSGKLVEKGNHISPAKVQELVASEPHFLAAGRTYTKHKAEAEALKKSKAYGAILRKLEKSLGGQGEAAAEAKGRENEKGTTSVVKKLEKSLGGQGEAAEEATYLTGRIQAHGKKLLEMAREAEGENPFAAQQAYTELSTNWKGVEVGDKASTRLKELKTDKAFQTELKASTMLQQILTECDKLVAQGGAINLGYGPNQKVASGVRASATALKKKFPDSKAVAKLPELLKGFGFKDI